MKQILILFAVLAMAGCGGSGGGGGGGGGGNKINLSGRIIWIETGSQPSPPATVRAGNASGQTSALDGFFDFPTDAGITSATVTYVPSVGSPVVRTFTFPAAAGDVDLGDLYIGPQVVTLKGKVTDASTNLPVGGATVKIAGREATSLANGNFLVTNVAYSSKFTAVFLGLEGIVTAKNYFARLFSPQSIAIGGIVDVGPVVLTPEGSVDPPPPPYDVQGSTTPSSLGANALVQAKQGASVIRRTTADGNGKFTLWLPVGTYTIVVTNGANNGQATVTVTSTNVIKSINVNVQ